MRIQRVVNLRARLLDASARHSPALSSAQEDQEVSLLIAQVHSQSILPRELGFQVMYLDNEPLALESVLVTQGRELTRIATSLRGLVK